MFTHEGDAEIHRHVQRRGSGPCVQGLRHTAYSSMPERDGKDEGEDGPKQAGARTGSLAIVD